MEHKFAILILFQNNSRSRNTKFCKKHHRLLLYTYYLLCLSAEMVLIHDQIVEKLTTQRKGPFTRASTFASACAFASR